jgi:hypothetical protein
MTSRRWTWTLNNWTVEEKEHIMNLQVDPETSHLRYLCFGEEVGESGTPHLQGYIELFKPMRKRALKRLLGTNRVHVEKARMNGETNRNYCAKLREEDETPNEVFYEIGELGRQGRRTDLEGIREMVRNGATDLEIADTHFAQWVRYRASIAAYRSLMNVPVTTSNYSLATFPESWRQMADSMRWTKCPILWGPPGIGKTQLALAMVGRALLVSHIEDLKSFNPANHDGIVFDDMSFTHMPISTQIHLVDLDFDRSIHCRYGNVIIPKGTKRIFTTNEDEGRIFDLSSNYGVKRRVEVHHLDTLEGFIMR